MNIGILGTGFGAYHAQILKKINQVNKVIIWGRNWAKLEELKAKLDVEITTQTEDILQHPDIDVVHICLPSHLHKQYIIAALEHGKHVFCETPLCLNIKDVHAIEQAQLQYDKKVLVNQFIKFDPAYVYLHEAIADQRYGPLQALLLKRETAPHWGDLGLSTITTNLMIHELDFVTWDARTINKDNIQVWGKEDNTKQKSMVQATVQSQNCISSVVANSQMPLSYPFTVGYEAYFEHTKLIFHESSSETAINASLIAFTEDGEIQLPLDSIDPFELSIRYAIEYFDKHASSEMTPSIGVDEAIKSITMALALQKKLMAQR